MRSRVTSVRLPERALEAGRRRAEALGYGSFNAYLLGLLRYDLLVRGKHSITLPMARMDLDRQDALDGELLALEEAGCGKRGVLLGHIVERAVARLGAGATEEEVVESLNEEFRR